MYTGTFSSCSNVSLCAGTFSSVFLACLKHHPDIKELFALKHIIPTSHPNRILGELTCLKLIGYVISVIFFWGAGGVLVRGGICAWNLTGCIYYSF